MMINKTKLLNQIASAMLCIVMATFAISCEDLFEPDLPEGQFTSRYRATRS